MIAAIVGAREGYFNYFAELETAAKCVEWVKDHLALDEIDIYLDKSHDLKHHREDREVVYTNLYDYMMAVVDTVPAGAGGVVSPRGCTATAARLKIRTRAACSSTSAWRRASPK